MKPEDEKAMIRIFNQGVEKVIVPYLVRIEQRLDGHDTRFAEIDARLDRMEETLDDHTHRLNRVEETLDDHTYRLGRIERKLDSTVNVVDEHSVEIKKIKKHAGMK